ncbi:membrane peptidoglycan carboxypeptidase [Haloactinopolyspora alba]|uniref:Membrane peptidoglycan carboxypeptidase n=1 Tax=Haloactinopolyspora alba TaxID=648780 RepID=A0A2P8E7A2_9ACTN|nr:transglycosylase domain-containing protein [Haloactinopolyspora alba]PSL05355.1 membrane peptidoglycan carboxypeptidase [Haloactinopolyspora alba]
MAIRPGAVVSSVRRVFLVVGVSALSGVLMAGLILPVVAGLGLTARESADAFADMPSELDAGPMAQRSVIVDDSGDRLATFYEENRVYVGLDKIAPVMQDAILAIEDDRFYERGPIDFQGTIRALMQNLEAGETTGGGSTLTQQYVKLVRLSKADTEEERQDVTDSTGVDGYRRKLEELRMAVGVEKELSKDKILERYLNIAYFGSGAHGIEAAARTYFSTSAAKLSIPQAAMLAGLVQRPYAYDPTRDPEAAQARRNTVLNRMADTGRITEKQAASARKQGLGLDVRPSSDGCTNAWAGYFCDYVAHEIRTMEELGGTPEQRQMMLERGGLRIQTTLNRQVQEAADEAVSDKVAPTDSMIGSIATVEPGTGHIRAIANSRKYGVKGEGVSNINYAVDQNMGGGIGIQPGSTFKVYVLAAAINQGIPLDTTINSPDSISIPEDEFTTCDGEYRSTGTWSPENWTGLEPGNYNLRTGTEMSVNTFFAQLELRTGICEPATIAEKTGMTRANAGENGVGEALEQVPSFTLGVNEVSPLSMAESYATFANRGVHCPATAIEKITDSEGNVLVDNTDPKCERVLEQPVADAVASVLEGVMHNPGATGNDMQLDDGRVAGGKTGTTQRAKAVWYVGFTPQLSTAVAVADVEAPQESLDGREYNGEYEDSACGSCVPGPMWKQMMDEAHEGLPEKDFPELDPEVIEGVSATVPDVRGMTEDAAVDTLEGDGFDVDVFDEVNSDLDEGLVVRTSPGPGNEVSSGTTIGLYLSNGIPPSDDDEGNGEGEGNEGEGNNDDDDDESEPPDIDLPTVDPSFPPGNEGGNEGGNDGWRD